jgi:sugar transferase (PEP-CTERM/EpsH1 system associated)
MKILYLAHRIPYPPNKGDKIRSYHHVRHLAQRHELHLLSFVDQPGDAEFAGALREYCASVVLISLDRNRALLRGARTLASGRSLSEGYFGSRAMTRAVQHAAASCKFDVAWAFSSVMAQYLEAAKAPWQVVDFVDVDSEKWRQFAAYSRGLARWGYRTEAARLRAFETRVALHADRVLFISRAEKALFGSFCRPSGGLRVVPIGVDTEYFRAETSADGRASTDLLFTGALDYRPNVEAVLYFTRHVLPLVRAAVPEARLIAVGHRPVRRLLREAARRGGALQIAGSVPDVRPYFRAAGVYVAPLQLGRGVQSKVLEAMAMRVPLVASPLAVEGVSIEPGTHALIAETPEQFAAAVVALLRHAEQRRRLTEAAFGLIEQQYTWPASFELVDACLQPDAAESQSPAEKNVWRVLRSANADARCVE